jgi:uncharacterized protein (DUF433 family)
LELARYDEDSPEEAKSMTFVSVEPTTIIRTERGLTIGGTRITIYDVMDYLKAQYPPKLIREKLGLSDGQLDLALDYIEQHRSAVEIEYQECLQTAAEIREYWEDRNRERFAQIAAMPPKPGQEALRAKLQEWKDRIEAQS